MTRLEANKLLVARDQYGLIRARSRCVKKIREEFEEGFEDSIMSFENGKRTRRMKDRL